MSTREPRFEIVRTDAGHHARFIAKNGRTVWSTEVYTRRAAALGAITLIVGQAPRDVGQGLEVPVIFTVSEHALLEVREVDERTGSGS